MCRCRTIVAHGTHRRQRHGPRRVALWHARTVTAHSAPSDREDQQGIEHRRLGLVGPAGARTWWLLLVVTLAAVAGWYAVHPAPLPRGDAVTVPTPAGVPVHLGVVHGGEREIRLGSVTWDQRALGAGDELEALVCRGGAVGTTRELDPFCADVVPAEGSTLGPSDQLVLRVTAAEPGAITVDGLRVTWRDGLQRGDQAVGPRLRIEVLER